MLPVIPESRFNVSESMNHAPRLQDSLCSVASAQQSFLRYMLLPGLMAHVVHCIGTSGKLCEAGRFSSARSSCSA